MPTQSFTQDSLPLQDSTPARSRRPADDDASAGHAPAKRARQARRHEDWWHLDGSVVLELRGVMFRLYRAQLARKSPFFERLFAGPAVDTVDSCPRYSLDRGTPEEFAALLRALDESLSSVYAAAKPTFREITPILRMATLYEFTDARAWAVALATHYFPGTLEGELVGSGGDAVDALLLARECRVPDILKGCMFELLVGLGGDSDAERLSSADLVRLVGARTELQHRWVAEVTRPPTMPCPDSTPVDVKVDCRNARSDKQDGSHVWMNVIHSAAAGEKSIFEEGLTNPIYAFALLRDVQWTKRRLCKRCAAAMKEKWEGMRRKWWDDLDELFGLEDK